MNKYIEVINSIFCLLSTIEEGLNHSNLQVSEHMYEESLGLLHDSMLGILSIEQAIEPITNISKQRISKLTENLKDSILKVIEYYENGKQELTQNYIEKEVIPEFVSWKIELENTLKLLIIN